MAEYTTRVLNTLKGIRASKAKLIRAEIEKAESQLIVIDLLARYKRVIASTHEYNKEPIRTEYNALKNVIGNLPKRSVIEKQLEELNALLVKPVIRYRK